MHFLACGMLRASSRQAIEGLLLAKPWTSVLAWFVPGLRSWRRAASIDNTESLQPTGRSLTVENNHLDPSVL